ESGTVYRSHAGEEAGSAGGGLPADEHHALAALLTGALAPATWRGPAPQVDFFAVKALLEALLGRLGVSWFVRAQQWPFLHPARAAAVLLDAGAHVEWEAVAGDQLLGFVGELHPLVAAAWDLESASVFALDLGRVAQAAPRVVAYRELAAVPPLRQDLAVAVPEDLPAQQIIQAV